tara:strand:- start:1557 stop:4346 length:2790 start_codon:yes stop_codon:yes gene_type:complete
MPPKISHKKSSKAFDDFIRLFKIKPEERDTTTPTHQRIGSKELGIYAGSYCIPDEKMDEFNKLYYESIIVNGNKEYLTERQYMNEQSPILVDLDLKYNPEISGRQHSDDDIMTIIETFLLEIKNCVELDETPFPVYVFHKENINKSSDECTKDGIHIIFGIQMSHEVQAVLRNRIIKSLPDKLDLPCTNKWENIIDNSISSGSSPWQLYGSRKPGHEAYKIDKYCLFQYKNEEFSLEECKSNNEIRMNLELFSKICARYKNNTVFPIKEQVLRESNKPKSQTQIKQKMNYQVTSATEHIKITDLTSIEMLDNIISKQFSDENLTSTDYDKMKGTHEYLMILPETYYNDFEKWIRVGWALRNTDDKLFVSWMKFSSQSDKFNINDIPEYYDRWCFKFNTGGSNLSNRSIAFWAKNYWEKFSEENNVENKYEMIKKNTLEYYVEEALKTKSDYDIAKVVHQLYKDKYVCTNIRSNEWYLFELHRWRQIDSASSLHLELSQHMYDIFQAKSFETTNIMAQYDNDDSRWNELQKKTLNILDILGKLKDSKKKGNIMNEAKHLFHKESDNFHQKTDDNPYLLGFTNGVIDFDQKTFRTGTPDDFITKTTGLTYIDPTDFDKSIVSEINEYFDKLFPNKNIKHYMWDSLASSLLGLNLNAAFNICVGSGSNGKSALMNFMKLCLGDYYGNIPTAYLTQKRAKTGVALPEIALLRGTRFVTCDEPNKGESLNVGIMKAITGGDELQARNLYQKGNFRFKPQFKIFPCTNDLFQIDAKDDGTWRRIKVVSFESKFVSKIDKKSDTPNQVIGIKHIEKKYHNWKETFLSLLVQRVFETEGVVEDCAEVTSKSNEYKLDQDFIKEFINTKVAKCDGDSIKKRDINEEFKSWFEEQYGNKYTKNMKELSVAMDKIYGKYNNGWFNVKILYDDSMYDKDII